ncbi:CPBP family intramembrane metalloprotease [Paenibacillus dendritiformis]|nr:CPBP family intramembrane metalloprotease [Paenibacillus dendritiformis]
MLRRDDADYDARRQIFAGIGTECRRTDGGVGCQLSRRFLVSRMVTALLFSIYHLPFRLFDTGFTGDFTHELAVCFTEGLFGGLILGFLWLRTNNLIAPVFVHSVIDAISGYESIMTKYHFW